MTGKYYLHYVDSGITWLNLVINYYTGNKGLDCMSGNATFRNATYYRDKLPLAQKLETPYVIYFNETTGTMAGYACADSQFLLDLASTKLSIPLWAQPLLAIFTSLLKNINYSLIAVGSKSPIFDTASKNAVASYINNLSWWKSKPAWKFPQEFRAIKQDCNTTPK